VHKNRGGSRPEDHNAVDKRVRRVDGGGTDEAQGKVTKVTKREGGPDEV
jgi:hypothetical protein